MAKIIVNLIDKDTFYIGKKGVTEQFPFDDVTLVFKVMHKSFLVASLTIGFIVYFFLR
jgi:hypothetical protein